MRLGSRIADAMVDSPEYCEQTMKRDLVYRGVFSIPVPHNNRVCL